MSKPKLSVVKIGGAVLEDPEMRTSFLEDFEQLKGDKILVHGGGRIATEVGNKLGIQAQMVEGRRVTDDATIDVVTMVYAGLVNKQLVADLQRRGLNAIGLTGADGNIIRSVKRPVTKGIDYGWVGDPAEVNSPFIQNLVSSGALPVIAPITHDKEGHLLNTNADTMAATLALALAGHYEVALVVTFELEGIMRDIQDQNSVIPVLQEGEYQALKSAGAIHSGMVPKLDNGFNALKGGVSSLRICKFDQIHTTNGSFLQI